MNSTILFLLLLLFCFLIWNADIAMAADIQTTPIVRSTSPSAEDDQKPANVGPHDPDKGKPHGMGVNVFLSRNVAVNGSVSLLSPEPSVLSGQPFPTGTAGGMGSLPSHVGGTVAFKLFF